MLRRAQMESAMEPVRLARYNIQFFLVSFSSILQQSLHTYYLIFFQIEGIHGCLEQISSSSLPLQISHCKPQ